MPRLRENISFSEKEAITPPIFLSYPHFNMTTIPSPHSRRRRERLHTYISSTNVSNEYPAHTQPSIQHLSSPRICQCLDTQREHDCKEAYQPKPHTVSRKNMQYNDRYYEQHTAATTVFMIAAARLNFCIEKKAIDSSTRESCTSCETHSQVATTETAHLLDKEVSRQAAAPAEISSLFQTLHGVPQDHSRRRAESRLVLRKKGRYGLLALQTFHPANTLGRVYVADEAFPISGQLLAELMLRLFSMGVISLAHYTSRYKCVFNYRILLKSSESSQPIPFFVSLFPLTHAELFP
jgi:hypothetical protein